MRPKTYWLPSQSACENGVRPARPAVMVAAEPPEVGCRFNPDPYLGWVGYAGVIAFQRFKRDTVLQAEFDMCMVKFEARLLAAARWGRAQGAVLVAALAVADALADEAASRSPRLAVVVAEIGIVRVVSRAGWGG